MQASLERSFLHGQSFHPREQVSVKLIRMRPHDPVVRIVLFNGADRAELFGNGNLGAGHTDVVLQGGGDEDRFFDDVGLFGNGWSRQSVLKQIKIRDDGLTFLLTCSHARGAEIVP
jgi:hypothetical protein